MPLATTKAMLLDAQRAGCAVPAFNAENMEMVQAIVQAAQEMGSPVIIQTTPSTIKYAGLDYFYAMVSAAAEHATVPIALHLDHGESFALACAALRAGYTSIMIDGSHLPFDENAVLTRKVAEVCDACGVPVEAELGMVGGKEDDRVGTSGGYTEPEDAAKFMRETGVGSLAVGIGTAHGFYKVKPVLDVERLSRIRAAVDVPLVLHGGTGLADDVIQDCIRRGIRKVNYATELRAAYSSAVKEAFAGDPDIIDPKKFGKPARERVMELVKHKIAVCRMGA